MTINGVAFNHDEVKVFVDGAELPKENVLEKHDERLKIKMPPVEVGQEGKVPVMVQ